MEKKQVLLLSVRCNGKSLMSGIIREALKDNPKLRIMTSADSTGETIDKIVLDDFEPIAPQPKRKKKKSKLLNGRR